MPKKTMTILMIGGEYRLQDGLRALLTSLPQNPTVQIENSASEAVQHIQANPPDLIVINPDRLDISIQDFFRRISLPDCHIPCISLVDTYEELNTALQAGSDSAILRGFSPQDLFGVIHKLLAATPEKTYEREKKPFNKSNLLTCNHK